MTTPVPNLLFSPNFAIASADLALALAGLPTYSDLLRKLPPEPGPLPKGVVALKDYARQPRKHFGLRRSL